MSNEADAIDDGDIGNDRSDGVKKCLFFVEPACLLNLFYILKHFNCVGELARSDNMESKDVQGNYGIALAAISKNGTHDNATRLVDAPFILREYAIYA
jgi:hypothetical protein